MMGDDDLLLIRSWIETAGYGGFHEVEIMREVRKRIAGGEPHYGQVLAKAIAEWFPLHAQSMDTVLALYIRQTGFDAAANAEPKKSGAA
jgi:hemerythrin